MAPSRRKGANKAAAATAAARQWKVGDLVLAKVKGFPAWPATVSEPEKWGYSADWKKVLVYFFGTQQIAFCNPADVEAFTEEKKESLSVKRHGKGSDFVRAVHEIIDSYEKLKKQDEVINGNSGDEVTDTNAGKLVESLGDSGLEEAPALTVKLCPKTPYSTRAKNDPDSPIDGYAGVTQKDALHDKETPSEETTSNLSGKEAPLPTTYSLRKKLGGIGPQNCVTQKRAPCAQRSRSSSRVGSCRFQNFILPSSNGSRSAGDAAADIMQGGSVRRNKRFRKSPDVSEGHEIDSLVFVSNGSTEENGSEIVTVDSDTLSFNEGSTVESGCELLQPESAVECYEGEVELSQRLDFQTKAVVVKKKRKPSKKRVSNDTIEHIGRVDKEAGIEIERHKTGKISPSDPEKLSERYSKEDGDEHLPLVKRARVRMGRPSSAGEELDTLIQTEEKSSEVSNCLSGRVCTSVNGEEDSPADGNSSVVKGGMGYLSPSTKCPVDKPQLWQVKKNQQFGCLLEGEAALPPSKRLHRALEAMSANAADDGQTSFETPSTMKTFINGHFSSARDCANGSKENKGKLEVQNIDSFSKNASQDGNSGFSASLNTLVAEGCTKHLVEIAACNTPVRTNNSLEHESCKDISVEDDSAGAENISGSSLGTHTAEAVVVVQSPQRLSPNVDGEQACLRCNQSSEGLTLPPNDDCEIENSELNKPSKEDHSEHSRTSSDFASRDVEIAIGSSQNDTNLLLYSGEGKCCETTKFWKLPIDVNNQANGTCEVLKETKATLEDSSGFPSPTAVKVTMAAVQSLHLTHSTSSSEDHLADKAVSGIRLCSSPADGLDSAACASPPNTLICNVATSENSNILENNGCCSPNVHLHHEKPKYTGKWSSRAEANAALTSFEVILGTLTRTKESIGRATRVAIDCAKLGNAAKVVEILARNLETEPSLHRRVDLFFLVDSITQCSRGLKGDVGGIYPSAIQAALPRLLLAAAPPGSSAQENRRQCLKVLRLWQERGILPDSIIRYHIRDLDSLSGSSSAGAFSRRQLRTERAFDDPLREMGGMLVDEYGSNSSFQLPGFCMPPMLKDEDEGSDSDGETFEAVTPEHNSGNPEEQERTSIPAIEKHRHILEDVDGELEMEDVAPSCEVEMSSINNVARVNTAQASHHQFEQRFVLPFAPPLPKDVPPSSPPLPTSPPPPPPPPPPSLPPLPIMPDPVANCLDSKIYVGTRIIEDDSQQSVVQQSVAPKMNPSNLDAVHYRTPENRDIQMQTQMHMQIPDSSNSCSFSSLPVSHQPILAVNSVQQADGATLHKKAFHLPPPHPAPSNQFSYVHADQRVQSLREIQPPSHPNRFHFVQSAGSGNFYSDHDRLKLAPHDIGENWRFSAPFSGPCYPDNGRMPYAPVPYTGLPCEPAIPNHQWAFPPQSMNHREVLPHRPPSEGPIPAAVRAPNFWRPR